MRKAYIDNLRCGLVLLVIVYHIVYLFNSVGVISNVDIQGSPRADGLLYVVYPWFMALLFLLAGVSARYGLKAKGTEAFWRERVRKLLVPSVAGIFLLGWISGFVTDSYVDMFREAREQIPALIKYFIYCFAGIGPLWFMHELILCTLAVLLLRKLDKQDRLWRLGARAAKLWILFLMFFAVWGSAQILNMPLVEVYRNGIYLLFFLLGYYVFSHEEVQAVTEKFWLPLLIIGVALGAAYTVYFWGENYSAMANLKKGITNAYAWFGSLALLGLAERWWNRETGFTRYMRGRSFGFYVLHYPLLVGITYVMDLYFELSFPLFYLILAALTAVMLPLLYEGLRRVPVIKRLLFGK